MAKQIKGKQTNNVDLLNQATTDIIAVAISDLFGTNLIHKNHFDKILKEKEDLLNRTKDISKVKMKLLKTECKLQAFMNYHRKWKLTTKSFEQKLFKLNNEKLYINFSEYPENVSENLKEAYKCYTNGLSVSCYIMILRTIEIVVNILYEQVHPPQSDKNGKQIFVSASVKLNWVKSQKMIGGADFQVAKSFIEARNDSVHELYIPTEKQILSAFETVISLSQKLKSFIRT